jgi:hypothetical protein
MAFTDTEKVKYLFKKSIGLANTQITGEYSSEEPNASRWSIYSTQMFQQFIPTSAPTDLQSNTTSDPQILYKSNSIQYPYIAKYSVLMTIPFPGSSNAYISPYLKNGISEQLDRNAKYRYNLFATSNGNCNILYEILNTNGDWVADPDSGIVTFYDYENIRLNGYTLSADRPPVITFFRYEGVIGPNTFQSVQYF